VALLLRSITARGSPTGLPCPRSTRAAVRVGHRPPRYRVDLEFGIGYGDDIPHAEKVLWSIIKDHPKVLADPEPVVKVHSLGDSSVNFIVRPWVARDDYWDVHWDFVREVKLRFDLEGVSIPFPQRDVHFYTTDSSITRQPNREPSP
jgi:small-conductance mechanosensitive channel